jgi:hypothetical protein
MSCDISVRVQSRILTGTLNFILFLKRPFPSAAGKVAELRLQKRMQVLQRGNYTGTPCKTNGPAVASS